MYGHIPFHRDESLRPNIVKHSNPKVERLLNQYDYRTKELQRYLNTLSKIDPDSLVLVLGDHLPPILGAGTKYEKDKYQTLAFARYKSTEFFF